ncbi:MAG: lysoplasmalogenase [Eubacteriales bacterium]|nr:lysoplasmalogenase [Eubacteriales bacterium]
MSYTVFLYLAIFLAFTGVHLYASKIRRASLRMATKPVILLAILGMYLEYVHYAGADPSAIVVFALVMSWLGDVLLIPDGVKWFSAGGVAFLLSHLLFIFAYNESGIVFSAISPAVIVLVSLVYAVTVCLVFAKLRPSLPKGLFYPMFAYLLTNGAMNCFAWFRLFCGLITGIGALLFFISDCTLFFVRFDKKFPIKSHFTVMLTYSVGEFLIALGFMLLA